MKLNVLLAAEEGQVEVSRLGLGLFANKTMGIGTETLMAQIKDGRIFNRYFGYYRIQNILKEYGTPKQVYIRPIIYGGRLKWDNLMNMILDYEEKGFGLSYYLPVNSVGADYQSCPKDQYLVDMVTWDVRSGKTFEQMSEYLNKADGLAIDIFTEFMTIEEGASYSLEEFHRTFSGENNTACINTRKDLWKVIVD